MRVVVLGAGGVGSVVAGYLARAGYDVIMIARPGHAAKVQQDGLHLVGLEDFRVLVPAFADAKDVHAADMLIVTVKTKDMMRALAGVAHMQIGGVASLQNGGAHVSRSRSSGESARRCAFPPSCLESFQYRNLAGCAI